MSRPTDAERERRVLLAQKLEIRDSLIKHSTKLLKADSLAKITEARKLLQQLGRIEIEIAALQGEQKPKEDPQEQEQKENEGSEDKQLTFNLFSKKDNPIPEDEKRTYTDEEWLTIDPETNLPLFQSTIFISKTTKERLQRIFDGKGRTIRRRTPVRRKRKKAL